MQGLYSIAAPRTVALSHRKPPSTGISRDISSGQDSDKRNAEYFELLDYIFVNYNIM
jgi:hypothetical protein